MSSEGKAENPGLYSREFKMETEEGNADENEEEAKRREAGYKIQAFLALQAWRRQKQEADELKFNIKTLSEKVEALQLQRYALRQLLDAEKVRLGIINNDVHKILNTLEDYKQEKVAMIKEKEQLQHQIKVLEEKFSAMENEYRNQKNDLLTAKLEARSWERQLEKEREKLSKIKSEKKLSIEDVQEVAEESKEATGANNRKAQREARIKNMACRNVKKNAGRGRDIGKIDLAWK